MGEPVSRDVLVLARFLMMQEAIREVDERIGGYPGDKRKEREVLLAKYMAHLPRVREILLREKP